MLTEAKVQSHVVTRALSIAAVLRDGGVGDEGCDAGGSSAGHSGAERGEGGGGTGEGGDGDSGDGGGAEGGDQCSHFPGIIPVFPAFLIRIHWYWYVVYKVVYELF